MTTTLSVYCVYLCRLLHIRGIFEEDSKEIMSHDDDNQH